MMSFSPILLLRTYVHQNSLDNIYNMGVVLFRQIVVLDDSIRYHMGVTLLDMVLKERRGEEVIDRELLKNACRMLVALGIEGEHHGLVYQDLFEETFLERSARFFSSESQKLLKQNSPASTSARWRQGWTWKQCGPVNTWTKPQYPRWSG